MAAIDFPNAPAVNQVFSAPSGVTYQWDGTAWNVYGATPPAAGAVNPPTYDTWSTKQLCASQWTVGDNVMQITQGTEIFNRSFAALDPTHPIEVDVDVPFGAGGAAVWAVAGIFVDGAAPAVAQNAMVCNTQWGNFLRLRWQGVLAAGAHTFTVRAGGANGQGVYVLGVDAYRVGGGTERCVMTIREVGTGVQGPPGPGGPIGGSQTGDTIMTYRSVPSVGWIVNNNGSIGDAGSGATCRANADTQNLFNLMWPFAGCAIAGGKGASAAADWGAKKALVLPQVASRLIGIATGASPGAGFTARNPGDSVQTTETPLTSVEDYATGINPQAGGWAFANQGHHHSQVVPASTYLYQHICL